MNDKQVEEQTNEQAIVPAKKPAYVPQVPTGLASHIANNNMAALAEFAEVISKSELSPYARKEDVITSLLMGHAYGFDPITSLTHIHVIEGKASIGLHMASALLRRAGVTFTTEKDLEPVYEYTTYQREVVTQKQFDANPGQYIVLAAIPSAEAIKKLVAEGRIPCLRKQVDVETVIRFERWLQTPNGQWERQIEYGRFTLVEATAAGLIDRPNWKKWRRAMCYKQAFFVGGRRIADDALLGVISTLEASHIASDPNFDDATLIIE